MSLKKEKREILENKEIKHLYCISVRPPKILNENTLTHLLSTQLKGKIFVCSGV